MCLSPIHMKGVGVTSTLIEHKSDRLKAERKSMLAGDDLV